MLKSLDPVSLFNAIQEVQNPVYEGLPNLDIEGEDANIHEFSRNENSIKVVFDQVNLKMLQVSNNFESITGYKENNTFTILRMVSFDHLSYPYVLAKWAKQVYDETKVLKNLKVASCGVKVKQKNGKEMRMLLRYSPLEVFENDTVKIAAVSVDDITHLMRSEAYWLRIETGENKKNVNHLISTDKKNQQQDIISPREKDVLRLIAQGMESKEIAEKLFISIYTVDNHRRNMIARTGVRDSTALIQICRMTGII